MTSPDARVEAIAARMQAAGLDPCVSQYPGTTHIETAVPEPMSASLWRDLLALLESADSFGMSDNGAADLKAWASISRISLIKRALD